jgi:KUP system potassium uptake protein
LLLLIAVLGLVLGFRSSDALASAYGIAVAGDMLVTSMLVAMVAREVWQWPWPALLPVARLFLAIDAMFVSANLHKIPEAAVSASGRCFDAELDADLAARASCGPGSPQ